MNGMPGAPSLWQEARNADGRVYYYNVQTKATQWAKPLELMTPVERALANQPWKEYTAEGGRKYWYNTETRQSTWDMPEVYKTALAQVQTPAAPPVAAPTFVAGGTNTYPYPQRDRDDYDRGPDRRGTYGMVDTNGMAAAATAVGTQQTDPEYGSFEEAEGAFMKLLRRNNVQPDWTWEQAMRAIIKDPQYRALKDPRDRKAAFEKYVVEVRAQEKDKAKERFAKLRADFNTMLKSHPEIKHYSRWKTIRPIIEGETIFRSTNDENERRQLFEEYIVDLKKAHMEQEAVTRKAAMDELVAILKALNLEPYTRWSEAQEMIQSNERIQNDDKFKTLSKSDILTAFENHIKALERTFNDARQQQKAAKARRERHNRERFIELLQELRSQGKIKAGSKWMNVHPLIQDDPRYVAMLGQSGSSPLDLFWDMVEEEERSLRGPRNDVLDVLDDKRYEVTPKTTFEEFNSMMSTDRRTANIDRDILQLIFQRIQEKVIRRSEDEKHAADRHQRRAVDALRSRIKHLEPPVRVTDTWEQVRPRVEKTEEYRAIESDELRQSAFDKVIRRLKEKEEDIDKERDLRDRDRGGRHDHYDRDHRNGQSYRRERRAASSRLSRTPEPDAYEADRRKAQADREKSYRKTSGLSPIRDRRDDRDRDRERDRDRYRERERERDRDRRPPSHYERERRDREEERERLYRTRGDPRGGRDELDYGDSRSTVSNSDRRRRRDSDAESATSRSAKRYRRDSRERERSRGARKERDRARDRASVEAEVKKEEKAVHSGSEEGEIEED
ncbi:U1 snRNP protein [Paecilomyces lecythidis]